MVNIPTKNDPGGFHVGNCVLLFSKWFRENKVAFLAATTPAARNWALNHPGHVAVNRARFYQSQKGG